MAISGSQQFLPMTRPKGEEDPYETALFRQYAYRTARQGLPGGMRTDDAVTALMDDLVNRRQVPRSDYDKTTDPSSARQPIDTKAYGFFRGMPDADEQTMRQRIATRLHMEQLNIPEHLPRDGRYPTAPPTQEEFDRKQEEIRKKKQELLNKTPRFFEEQEEQTGEQKSWHEMVDEEGAPKPFWERRPYPKPPKELPDEAAKEPKEQTDVEEWESWFNLPLAAKRENVDMFRQVEQFLETTLDKKEAEAEIARWQIKGEMHELIKQSPDIISPAVASQQKNEAIENFKRA